ncbi:uncharacterized protein NEMAJ01_1228 [Nematocida major]|uniref:uncharacterized protein n=1 Tax=Nematocida major TaxID=1912982 RepID=UPI0020087620|nr:uncharacterized protein NEMAJ01_1228 [Nematocida major]KAH9386332.1 hypothetical protein NEMAJ01_1228 [Nematocida major]
MDFKGYYKLLGVDKNASEREIKRAYRDLAKKYHSDGSAVANAMKECKTDQERAELKKSMDKKFSEITNAYEVLSSPEKRQAYDRGIDEQQGPGGFGGFSDMGGNSFFSSFFGGSMGGSMFGEDRRRKKNNPKVERIHIRLQDVLLGGKVSKKIARSVVCMPCKATGSMNTKTCEKCRGAGAYVEIVNMGGIKLQREAECNQCEGQGIVKTGPSCRDCAGRGYVVKTETDTIHIPKGVMEGHKICRKGMGDELYGVETGDLIYVISIAEHDTYTRVSQDTLYTEIKVPIANILKQAPISLTTLDNRKISIECPSFCGKDVGEDFLCVEKEGLAVDNGQKGPLLIRVVPEFVGASKMQDLAKEIASPAAADEKATHKAFFVSKSKVNKSNSARQGGRHQHEQSSDFEEEANTRTCATT